MHPLQCSGQKKNYKYDFITATSKTKITFQNQVYKKKCLLKHLLYIEKNGQTQSKYGAYGY